MADGGSTAEATTANVAGSGGRIADIEILRAFAILFVLYEHVRFNLFPWGTPTIDHLTAYFQCWSGVDLFFAISGFVIARSLLPKLAAADGMAEFLETTLAFWIRRAWRLVPSAWLWLALILVLTVAFNRSGAFGTFEANFKGALAGMLDVANLRTIQTLIENKWYGASFPHWSLSLEEQFYFLLPWLVFLFGRRFPVVAGIIVAIQLFSPRLHSFFVMVRCDALFLGVLIAIWSRDPTYQLFQPTGLAKSRLARGAVLFGLLGLIGMMSPLGSPVVSFPVGVVAILSAALVLIASYDRDYLMRAGPIKTVLLWIGSRSYTIYLTHVPCYFLAREIWFRIEPPGTVFGANFALRYVLTALPLLLVLTELNYRLVETPLRRKGARIAERFGRRTSLLDPQAETSEPIAALMVSSR